MKIDKATFDFQVRLIKSEVKNESLADEILRLKGDLESCRNHNAYLIQQVKDYQDEVKSLNRSLDWIYK